MQVQILFKDNLKPMFNGDISWRMLLVALQASDLEAIDIITITERITPTIQLSGTFLLCKTDELV